MEKQLKKGQTGNSNMTMEVFKKSLNDITPLDALQNFKELIDRSLAAGMFQNTESVLVVYQSLDVLYLRFTNEPEREESAEKTE